MTIRATTTARLKHALKRGSETMLALLLVICCFVGFTVIISFSFPAGTNLRDLMFNLDRSSSDIRAARIDLHGLEEDPEPFVAYLTDTQRVVKGKRSDEITWRRARSGTPLEDRHSVQTSERSGATISFGADNELKLGENSWIVVRKIEQDRKTTRRQASMVMLEGELAGRTDAAADDSVGMAIHTPGGASMIVSPGSDESDFKVTVNPDETATFAVFDGVADVTSGGETVHLESDHAVTVARLQKPPKPVALPAMPRGLSPADSAAFAYRALPPRVAFRWDATEGTQTYRMTISRDLGFNDVVFDKRVDSPEFVHGNLPAGLYYWRVAAIDGWAEGRSTAPRALRMLQDDEPPTLAVAFPDEPVRDRVLLLRGTTESGATVLIGDQRITTASSGDFEHSVSLRRGPNVVVVEAVDAAGNISYQTSLIHAKY